MTRKELLDLHSALTAKAKELMEAKNSDYASDSDPFRNFEMFGELGILVRMSDKLARLRSFVEKGSFKVKDESVLDTVLDLINYSVLFHGYLKHKGKLEEPKIVGAFMGALPHGKVLAAMAENPQYRYCGKDVLESDGY